MKQQFIICDNLVKIFKYDDLEVVALQGLDLVVNKGEMVGIVGVSGSGKSTLMNILGGLDRPSAGKVWVNNQDLLKLSDQNLTRFRTEQVGFVWQQSTRNLIPYLSAIENVYLPLTISGDLTAENKEYCAFLLETIGMADFLSHKPSELSGGQQQRIAIAIALANHPNLLLADEPTGEMDSKTAENIYHIFHKINQDLDLTTLIVSHDQTISQHVDRVVSIRDGRLSTETVRQNRSGFYKNINTEHAQEVEEQFEELTVIDSVGRLQISQEYLDQFNIRGRVRLEITEEGILIKPAHEVDYSEDAEQLTEKLQANQVPWYQQANIKIKSFASRFRKSSNPKKKRDEA